MKQAPLPRQQQQAPPIRLISYMGVANAARSMPQVNTPHSQHEPGEPAAAKHPPAPHAVRNFPENT